MTYFVLSKNHLCQHFDTQYYHNFRCWILYLHFRCQSLKSEAKKLREMGPGVQLFALGVSNARACELDIITGNGADLAFGVSDYNSFESFAKAMRQVAKDDYNGCI